MVLGLKDWQTINFVQLKIRLSIPVKLNGDFSNGEEVALQKYELIRYECVHYGKPRAHKYVVDNSRPNTVSHAVGCECFLTYKWQEDHFELFKSCKKHLNHPETNILAFISKIFFKIFFSKNHVIF